LENGNRSGGVIGDYVYLYCEVIRVDKVKGHCDKCEKYAELTPVLYANDEERLLCAECEAWEEVRADAEYERQREEGLI
jgi:hypothetical protein